jgi:signal transduction histidine kinase
VPGIAQIEAGKPMAAGGFLLHYDGPNPHATLDEWALLAMSWAGEKATRDLAERARELTKAHEQRQALAFANHVLKTPLLEAKAIADALPGNVQARAAILHVLEQLLDLEHFVKLALRHQKEVRFVTRSIPEFVAEVTFFLERLCRIFENPEVSDYAAMAGHVAKGRSLLEAAHDGRELPVLQDGGAVRWSRRQLFSVMDGLLTNALKYNVPGPQACLKVFLDSDHDRVFLNVSSASAIGGDSLLGLVADLNRGGNTDWIGVHLIHEATRACEGFAGPQWIALPDGIADGTPLIAARVQVAELTAGAP